MLYFSNQELGSIYHVSVRTVRNWIESAKANKIELTLHTKGERSYIANTEKNIKTMEKLALSGKKYRPHKSFKTLTPHPEFYQLYSPEQIHDIISNIEIYHEIPPDYNYFEHGATEWDQYAQRLAKEDGLNSLNATLQLLQSNITYIDNLLKDYKYVNVVDIGIGNVLPVKHFLEHLMAKGKLGRYIALDISASMLDIAEHNIREWFGDDIHFERRLANINFDRFTDLLVREYTKKESDDTVNVIMFLGGTLGNFRSPESVLRTIHDSMGIKDVLIYEKKLDTETTRKRFDFDAGPGVPTLTSIYGFVVDLLNIDKSLYEMELGYDEIRRERYERIRFNVALTIRFEYESGERDININKNDTLLIWRGRQQSALDIIHEFDENNFYNLQASQTGNQEYLLTISRIKHS